MGPPGISATERLAVILGQAPSMAELMTDAAVVGFGASVEVFRERCDRVQM